MFTRLTRGAECTRLGSVSFEDNYSDPFVDPPPTTLPGSQALSPVYSVATPAYVFHARVLCLE